MWYLLHIAYTLPDIHKNEVGVKVRARILANKFPWKQWYKNQTVEGKTKFQRSSQEVTNLHEFARGIKPVIICYTAGALISMWLLLISKTAELICNAVMLLSLVKHDVIALYNCSSFWVFMWWKLYFNLLISWLVPEVTSTELCIIFGVYSQVSCCITIKDTLCVFVIC